MIRAFQWDLARQVERLDHLLALLPRYAEWGYTRLYLHLEDAVDYPSLPGIARADAYTWDQLRLLVATASAHGIQTVPIANLLGHTQYIIKHPDWRDLNELRDPVTGAALPAGQICPLHPRTPDLVERLFRDLAPLCTAGEIHAGLDESFHLGKHPLSRAEIAEVGLAAHFARHVTRLRFAATRHGLRLGLWADMLALLPDAIPLLSPVGLNVSSSSPAEAEPSAVQPFSPSAFPQPDSSPGLSLYDWYYHPFTRHPRVELYNFFEYNLPGLLAKAQVSGLSPQVSHSHWACPMNGAFRHESAPVWTDRLQNLAAWHRRALATSAAGFLVTSWEPHRLAFPTTTLMDAAAATLWLDPSVPDDPASLLAAGLRRYSAASRPHVSSFKFQLSPAAARSAARRLLATDTLAFCGNSRWEINSRWDTVAPRRESPLPHARAARQFTRLATTFNSSLVRLSFLAATARFQAFLASRDAFVRTAASHVHRLRRQITRSPASETVASALITLTEACVVFSAQLRAARADARRLWTASRPAATFAASPNFTLLRADAARLRTLRTFIRATTRRPAAIFRASPVCGRWTLRFTLHHFAPAHQKVVIEQLRPDPAAPSASPVWRELHSRVLIEFRAAAARPHPPNLRFEFAVPVEDPDAPLRIASRCRGQFAVSHIELTDGITTRQHLPLRTRHTLGTTAPASGWPNIDWLTNTATLPLHLV
jgi:hypothetical protein